MSDYLTISQDAASTSTSTPTTIPMTVGHRKPRARSHATKSSISTPPASSASMKSLAAQVLSNYPARQQPDTHALFGEYIASESRNLPNDASDELRDRIFKTLSKFKAERRAASQGQSLQNVQKEHESTSSLDNTNIVTLVDEGGRQIGNVRPLSPRSFENQFMIMDVSTQQPEITIRNPSSATSQLTDTESGQE